MKKSIVIVFTLTAFVLFSSFVVVRNVVKDKNETTQFAPMQGQSESAYNEPIKKNGKTVGSLEYTVKKNPEGNYGLIVINFYNNSDEDISFTITGKGADSCTESGIFLGSYKKKEVSFSCSENPSGFKLYISVV